MQNSSESVVLAGGSELPGTAFGSSEVSGALTAAPLHRYGSRRDPGLADRLVLLSLFSDIAVVVYAMFAAYWLRFESTWLAGYHMPAQITLPDYLPYMIAGASSLVLMLSNCRLYEKQSLLRYRFVSMQVAKACVLWFAAFLAVALVFSFRPPVSRLFVLLAGVHATGGLLIWRAVFHRVLRRSPLATSLRQRLLFVGWNEEAARIVEGFGREESPAYEVVGCVSPENGSFNAPPPAAIPLLGAVGELEDVLHRERVEMVLLTDLNCVKAEIVGLVNRCEKEMVQFKLIPSYFQILVSGLHLETVNGIPVLGVERLPLDRWVNRTLKRCVDVAGAIVGLVLSAPLIALFGYLVYRESPGPIFYRQQRLGQNGVLFHILKIRSMRVDAERNGVGWSTKDDPRRLAVGSFMRKWNIDELPQFWNVLKGEMSLVGPRPERPELIWNFKDEIPHYNARHNAKPGMTGWAQVKGFRGDTDLTERVRCDLFYLENWNLLLDFQIMAMTVASNKNAC